jgi:putative FmdB family regulatory protein
MPTYQYICKECDYQFDKMQAMSAKVLKKCPRCGKKRLIRLIGTAGGVIVKGTNHPVEPIKEFKSFIEGKPERIIF